MFTTEKTRSGELTLLVKNRYIHSKYNPQSEAESFLEKQIFKRDPHLIIVIGSGLGYLKKAILDKYKNIKVFSIFLDKGIYNFSRNNDNCWIYKGDNLKDMLTNFIPDFLLPETSVIKWIPCTQLFPERTEEVEKIVYQFFLERKGSIFTTLHFGRKWIRNFILNYGKQNTFLKVSKINLPVIIAASGPSLSKSIKLLKYFRNKYLLAALPSSLAILNSNNIIPDLVFNSDPGFWAREHFKYLSKDVPVVMPLSAAFFSNLNNPVVCISQNTFLEKIFIENKLFTQISAHGTVAGTAYLYLRKITNKPIVFTGLDFCYKDIQEHVKPHSFDYLFKTEQSRINTELHLLFERKKLILGTDNSNKNGALSTYSGWFNSYSKHKNVYRLNPTKIKTLNIKSINESALSELLTNYSDSTLPFSSVKISISNPEESIIRNIKKVLHDIDSFINLIPAMDSSNILSFFSGSNYLNELFQFTEYKEITELAKYYSSDSEKSKKILNRIATNTYDFFYSFLLRLINE